MSARVYFMKRVNSCKDGYINGIKSWKEFAILDFSKYLNSTILSEGRGDYYWGEQ